MNLIKINLNKCKYLITIFIIFIIFIIFYVNNFFIFQNKDGFESPIQGGVKGYIKRSNYVASVKPLVRSGIRKARTAFSNPDVEYYMNKLNQIFM